MSPHQLGAAALQQERDGRDRRDGGHHGDGEGTEGTGDTTDGGGRRDGGHHGREGIEREQQRWQWSGAGRRRETRSQAWTRLCWRASLEWP